jgi:hypothetical protein
MVAPELALERMDFHSRAISPLRELGAYEALWDKPETTFKTLSEKFSARPNAVPSDFVPPKKAREYAEFVRRRFHEADVTALVCACTAPANIRRSCAMPPTRSSCCITKDGGI